MYRVLSVGSDFHEICDECGFHGGTLDLSRAVVRLRARPDRWSEVMSQADDLLRARPAPDTWCAVEYAQHVVSAIGGIEWAARIFAAGRSPDWDELQEDKLPGVFEHETHDCDRFDITDTVESLGAVRGAHIGCDPVTLVPSRSARRSVTPADPAPCRAHRLDLWA
jgi:hypothetical protein